MQITSTEMRTGGAEAMMEAQGIDGDDIVHKLRYAQHYTSAKWAGEAADEIEKLRASVAAIHCHALMGTSLEVIAMMCDAVFPRLAALRPNAPGEGLAASGESLSTGLLGAVRSGKD